jgi:CheY-like chemotaxis protein
MNDGASATERVGARVLVVEGHADSAASMARLLELFGHQVQIARDGPQAIAASRR